MLKLALPIILAAGAGISVVIQQALNANLRTALSSAAWSGFVSYFIGLVCMAAWRCCCRILSHRWPRPPAYPVGVERWPVRRHLHRPRNLPDPATRLCNLLRHAHRRPDARVDRLRPLRGARGSRPSRQRNPRRRRRTARRRRHPYSHVESATGRECRTSTQTISHLHNLHTDRGDRVGAGRAGTHQSAARNFRPPAATPPGYPFWDVGSRNCNPFGA